MLDVQDLTVVYQDDRGRDVPLVEDISFTVLPREVLCIVGEAGSGKSVTMLAVMGLLPPELHITSGSIRYRGEELVGMPEKRRRALRGKEMGMVFQDPMTALNPVKSVGSQIGRALSVHNRRLAWGDRDQRVAELLASVGVPQPKRRSRLYPHEWSGGMRQRAVIAMAIANSPSLLVADEPTTALDTTVQAQVMEALETARETSDAAMVMITHDLALVAQVADRVAIMYSGSFVETGSVYEIFDSAQHPYTKGLLASILTEYSDTNAAFAIPGSPPAPSQRPEGCAFAPRCTSAGKDAACLERPALLPMPGSGERQRAAACHHPGTELLNAPYAAPAAERAGAR
ncbi:ATP-binding cassette domain-containing protein [Nesterenkonia alkaliphila]|uniref:ATP-binding cassette domain-containing protein n=1 Tax=Nesterenkonia alkaliphila TaxID=1463631 RepID=A0A7K1UJP6_9MICC|nr:ATP-binding cassette domain-containing protein [Nesterenkonia alkaliphila]